LRTPATRVRQRRSEKLRDIDRLNLRRGRVVTPSLIERDVDVPEQDAELELARDMPRRRTRQRGVQPDRHQILSTRCQRHRSRDVRIEVEWMPLQQRI